MIPWFYENGLSWVALKQFLKTRSSNLKNKQNFFRMVWQLVWIELWFCSWLPSWAKKARTAVKWYRYQICFKLHSCVFKCDRGEFFLSSVESVDENYGLLSVDQTTTTTHLRVSLSSGAINLLLKGLIDSFPPFRSKAVGVWGGEASFHLKELLRWLGE